MALTEAQRKAQQKYRQKKGGTANTQTTIGATVSPAEAERIKATFKAAGVSNAEVLKRAAARIEQGDDLTGMYDRESGRIVPIEEK